MQGPAATLLQSEGLTCADHVDSKSSVAPNFVYSRPSAGKGELPRTTQRDSLNLPMKTSNKDERMGAARRQAQCQPWSLGVVDVLRTATAMAKAPNLDLG